MLSEYGLLALYSGIAAGILTLLYALYKKGALTRLLIAAKSRPTEPDVLAEYRNDAKTLKHVALLPELLSVSLTLAWAWSAREDSSFLFSLIFCAGFVGFMWLKAVSVPRAIQATQARHFALVSVLSFAAIGSLLMLLVTSVFDASNTSDTAALQRLEASKPALALDEQIAHARAKLDGLSSFSNAEKAAVDQQTATNQQAATNQQRTQLQSQLSSLQPPAMPSDMARYMAEDCTPKRNGNGTPYTTRATELCPSWQSMQSDYQSKRAAIQAEINAVNNTGITTSYADKYAEYQGVQTHLEGLLTKRAELSGDTVQAVWRKEDRIIADWLGIKPEQANSIKWLLFAICFDVLALAARIGSALMMNIAGGDPNIAARKKFNALVASGITPETAAGLVGNTSQNGAYSTPKAQPARVSSLDDALKAAPALDVGGYIESDGIAHLHKGELVLTAKQTADYLAQLRAQQDTPDQYARVQTTPAYNARVTDTPAYAATDTDSRDFVPKHLAGKKGAGRVGKWDHCIDCNSPYLVTAHNKLRCNQCSERSRTNYSKTTAKAKTKTV